MSNHPLRSTSPPYKSRSAAISSAISNNGERSQSNLTKLLQSNESGQNFFSHNVSKRNLVSAYSNNSAKVITAFGMNSIIKRAKQIRMETSANLDLYTQGTNKPLNTSSFQIAPPMTSSSLSQLQQVTNPSFATQRNNRKNLLKD